MIFADDTIIYLSCLRSELNSGIARITHDVDVIANYARENSLQLNISKSKVLILGSRAFVSHIDLNTLPPIMVEGKAIPFVNEVRNLGDNDCESVLARPCHVCLQKGAFFFT